MTNPNLQFSLSKRRIRFQSVTYWAIQAPTGIGAFSLPKILYCRGTNVSGSESCQ